MTRRRKPAWYTAADAKADRAAKYGTDAEASSGRPGGILAHFDGFCWACDRTIVRGESRVMPRRGGWVCVACAGARDE